MNPLYRLIGILAWTLSGAAFPQCRFAPPAPLTLHTARGCSLLTVELARSREQLRCGLSGRERLPADQGMLFDFRGRNTVTMWMYQTKIPLDMLFIDAAGRIIGIHAGAVPQDTTPIQAPLGTVAVLEIRGGAAAANDIVAGSRVRHPLFGHITGLATAACSPPCKP